MPKTTERTKRIIITVLIALVAALQGGNLIDVIRGAAVSMSAPEVDR
jgi:hypothetical protein